LTSFKVPKNLNLVILGFLPYSSQYGWLKLKVYRSMIRDIQIIDPNI